MFLPSIHSWADELLATLGKIRDAEFVTVLCVEAALPDIITTKKILNYAKERLANTTKVSFAIYNVYVCHGSKLNTVFTYLKAIIIVLAYYM